MYTVPNTELTYTDADKIALEYYLGASHETLEQWAQRTWANFPHEEAVVLWDKKKERRREELAHDFGVEGTADGDMVAIKAMPHYSTRDEQEAAIASKRSADEVARNSAIQAKVDTLRGKGYDDETIGIIYPESVSVL